VTGARRDAARERHQLLAVATAFLTLFSIVGFAFYGLPFFYDFFVRELGWTRAQVTSGNALARLVIGPLFGFFAGVIVDRFGPRRLMLVGILFAGIAPIGLGGTTTLLAFYTFYLMNALGYVVGGPLPNQVMLSRWFDAGRGKAMGIAYLGIGVGGALVPLLAHALTQALGWRQALQLLGAERGVQSLARSRSPNPSATFTPPSTRRARRSSSCTNTGRLSASRNEGRADEPPSMRGLVEIDAVAGRVLGEYTEPNPEDWSKYGLGDTAGRA